MWPPLPLTLQPRRVRGEWGHPHTPPYPTGTFTTQQVRRVDHGCAHWQQQQPTCYQLTTNNTTTTNQQTTNNTTNIIPTQQHNKQHNKRVRLLLHKVDGCNGHRVRTTKNKDFKNTTTTRTCTHTPRSAKSSHTNISRIARAANKYDTNTHTSPFPQKKGRGLHVSTSTT